MIQTKLSALCWESEHRRCSSLYFKIITEPSLQYIFNRPDGARAQAILYPSLVCCVCFIYLLKDFFRWFRQLWKAGVAAAQGRVMQVFTPGFIPSVNTVPTHIIYVIYNNNHNEIIFTSYGRTSIVTEVWEFLIKVRCWYDARAHRFISSTLFSISQQRISVWNL